MILMRTIKIFKRSVPIWALIAVPAIVGAVGILFASFHATITVKEPLSLAGTSTATFDMFAGDTSTITATIQNQASVPEKVVIDSTPSSNNNGVIYTVSPTTTSTITVAPSTTTLIPITITTDAGSPTGTFGLDFSLSRVS
jgi:hypothetical protein